MDMADIAKYTRSDWHALKAANPDWEMSLYAFFKIRYFSDDQVWEYARDVAMEEGLDEPEWL